MEPAKPSASAGEACLGPEDSEMLSDAGWEASSPTHSVVIILVEHTRKRDIAESMLKRGSAGRLKCCSERRKTCRCLPKNEVNFKCFCAISYLVDKNLSFFI